MQIPTPALLGKLTIREREVANLVADGYDNTHISKTLGIKRAVVGNMLGRVYSKLDMNTWSGFNIRVVLANVINAVKYSRG